MVVGHESREYFLLSKLLSQVIKLSAMSHIRRVLVAVVLGLSSKSTNESSVTSTAVSTGREHCPSYS